MKIIIDAMSGDNAPDEIVKGAALASLEYDAELILVGDEPRVRDILSATDADMSKISVVHSDSVITMEDEPTSVVRAKKDSSMAVGLRLCRDGGDAFVSAGNTGALHVGGSLIIRAVKGVERAAIATVLPFERPLLLLDCGANVNVTPDYYVTWAVLGQIYMKNVFGIDAPKVGLLNNGTEEHKGTETEVTAYKMMSEDSRIDFIGNIEGKEVTASKCDVLITDGFTGNVLLKTIEGMSKFMFSQLKSVFNSNFVTKLSAVAVKKELYAMKNSFDPSQYGGAPFLGLNKPVIKAHGSSKAMEIKNAVKQAVKFTETGTIKQIEDAFLSEEPSLHNDQDQG